MKKTSLLLAAVAAFVTSWAPHASAHGGLWRPDQIRIEPTDPSHIVVRSDVWGFVESRDGGASWQWLCAEAAGGDSIAVQRRPFVVLPGGDVIFGGDFNGVFRASGSLCSLEQIAYFAEAGRCGMNDCLARDVVLESQTQPRALVLTAGQRDTTTFANLLFRTPDGGASWTALADTLPSDIFASAVTVAPSDPDTLYVLASTTTQPLGYLLLRSRDGGATWSSIPLPISRAADAPPITLRFYGVNPQDPEMVFVWSDADAGQPNVIAADGLWVSTDGGDSVRPVFTATNDLPGFAVSADGATYYLGSTDDGLLSGSIAALAADGGGAPTVVDPGATWALQVTAEGLLVGRQDFGAADFERMSLGLSADYGTTFDPRLVICDVVPMDCPADSSVGNTCGGLFDGPNNFSYDQQGRRCSLLDAGTDAAGSGSGGTGSGTGGAGATGGSDAGLGGSSGSASAEGGCGCRTSRGTGAPAWVVLAGVLGVALGRRRRR